MKPLRVLNVEDSEDDSLLIRRELVKAGYSVVLRRVETANDMAAALDEGAWDVVIADYSLPRFSAPDALNVLAQRGLEIPFILVSGVLTEERAVSVVGARASDYLLKGNLARLAPAIGRALQENELKHETNETRDALEQEISAREEERARIARELHDEAGQLLASLLARARVIEEATTLVSAKARALELRELTSHVMDAISRLAIGLHPTVLDDLGLTAVLRYHADEYAKAHKIEVVADIADVSAAPLTRKAQLGIYRIVQEALTNVAKHAGATAVSLVLEADSDIIRVRVEDNGRGFAARSDAEGPGRRATYGLRSMHDRAAIIGARLEISSSPGRGSSVLLTVPLRIQQHMDRVASHGEQANQGPHRG